MFAFDESLLRLAKLMLQLANLAMERAKVALGGQVERTGDSLDSRVERALEPPAITKPLHDPRLHAGVVQELRDARILQQLRDAKLLTEATEALVELTHRRRTA